MNPPNEKNPHLPCMPSQVPGNFEHTLSLTNPEIPTRTISSGMVYRYPMGSMEIFPIHRGEQRGQHQMFVTSASTSSNMGQMPVAQNQINYDQPINTDLMNHPGQQPRTNQTKVTQSQQQHLISRAPVWQQLQPEFRMIPHVGQQKSDEVMQPLFSVTRNALQQRKKVNKNPGAPKDLLFWQSLTPVASLLENRQYSDCSFVPGSSNVRVSSQQSSILPEPAEQRLFLEPGLGRSQVISSQAQRCRPGTSRNTFSSVKKFELLGSGYSLQQTTGQEQALLGARGPFPVAGTVAVQGREVQRNHQDNETNWNVLLEWNEEGSEIDKWILQAKCEVSNHFVNERVKLKASSCPKNLILQWMSRSIWENCNSNHPTEIKGVSFTLLNSNFYKYFDEKILQNLVGCLMYVEPGKQPSAENMKVVGFIVFFSNHETVESYNGFFLDGHIKLNAFMGAPLRQDT